MRMKSKTVMIADADSASGIALIRCFADEGADLILNSRSSGDRLQETLAYCRTKGAGTQIVNVDLGNAAEAEEGLRDIAGEADALVLNGRLVRRMRIEDGEEAEFARVFAENATSAFVAIRTIGGRMAEAGSGSIIVVGSIHAEKPSGSSFAYSVSQGAVQMLVREAALTLGREGVRVNYIQMGPVERDDEEFRSDLTPLYESYRYKIPAGVMGTYEDLAECALYLASDASRYVNGADIRLDGGFVLHYFDHKMKRDDAAEASAGGSER